MTGGKSISKHSIRELRLDGRLGAEEAGVSVGMIVGCSTFEEQSDVGMRMETRLQRSLNQLMLFEGA